MKYSYRRNIVWEGKTYHSIPEAARATGISYYAMYHRAKMGYTCEADLKREAPRPTPCKWNGQRYDTIKEAAEANGVTDDAMRLRLLKGYTCDGDLKW